MREKKHFPDIHNKRGVQPKLHPTGRVYIPHGYSKDIPWRPHPVHQSPQYSENGPDWKSMVTWMPDPEPSTGVPEIWPTKWYSQRHFPDKFRQTQKEWTFYDDGYRVGKKCYFKGDHLGNTTSTREITHSMLYGKGRFNFQIDKRNGINRVSEGDKPYQAVEYSKDFYKYGSARPIVNFGGGSKLKADTFVPLQELPAVKSNYIIKEDNRRQKEEVDCVQDLETWRPATPLKATSTNNNATGTQQ